MSFRKDFVWGVAAASYQVEGATRDDGRGLSVWDMLCRKPGAIWNGQTGDVACDHYHRYKEDVAIMKQIGVQAYRLSVAWPRVIPNGTGAVNAKGLDFYDKLVDELLRAKIQPFVTLFHWDFPYELYVRGGWLNRDSADWFADYTRVVVDRLSDRVKHWMTLNEPQCFIGLGHYDGRHAPGDKLGWTEILRAGHHAMLAHGRGVAVIRDGARRAPVIGYAPVGAVKMPASSKPADVRAARRAMFSITSKTFWNNTWWMDPVFLGRYPEDGWKVWEKELPPIKDGDLKTISQPVDFFGVNIYSGEYIHAGQGDAPEPAGMPVGHDLTAFRWPVTPDSLYWGPKFFQERYKKPVYITENGISNVDWVSVDGKVHDPQRIDFLYRYLRELRRAAKDGVDVRGYFQWSIMDNFEWAEGFKERFGLVYVDYPTQKRTIKDSGFWYRNVIKTNGKSLDTRPL